MVEILDIPDDNEIIESYLDKTIDEIVTKYRYEGFDSFVFSGVGKDDYWVTFFAERFGATQLSFIGNF